MAKTKSTRAKRNGCAVTENEMKAQNNVFLAVAMVLFAVGLAILIEQSITWGKFFEPGDFFHHESFAILFIAVGGGILIARYAVVKRRA